MRKLNTKNGIYHHNKDRIVYQQRKVVPKCEYGHGQDFDCLHT